ncbi:MAG: FAD-dependent oxidoreductase [Oscillospiraceae bacterium]|jgi:hypothetical protein|nr:FAD-dependent oxidoreductase [Oscillospiraceae bacterium]
MQAETIKSFIRDVKDHYDVIVVGGGPAGIGAAVSAAKNGADTLLLEGRSFFGGVASVALWMPMNRMLLNGGDRGGVHTMLIDKLKEYGDDACRPGKVSWVDGDGMHIHPDYLRLAVFNLLEEVGCHYRLYSPVTDVLMDGDTIKGVVVNGKGGRKEYTADVIIDATGDGDVAYYSGAEMEVGGENGFMKVSLVFALANVDVDKLIDFYLGEQQNPENYTSGAFKDIIAEAKTEGFYTSYYHFDRSTVPGVVSVNNGGYLDVGELDGSNITDLNIAERFGIQVAVDFVALARKKKIPGLENCCLVRTGANVGVRESRRIVGDYVLTLEDSQSGKDFDDIVARRYGAIDAGGLAHAEGHKMFSGHAFPYRSMLPKRIENMLVAGRCSSTTQMGQAAGKSMGNMMDLGQAAGAAAAISTGRKIRPRNVDAAEIRERLIKMGVSHF